MSTPLARLGLARTNGRVTWLSIVGVILVPLVIAGILIWSLWNPQDRLDTVNAAIVNNDAPVTIDGQMVPLGRQLSAGLVGGADSASGSESDTASTDSSFNYNWVITDESDAADGLASGRFAAVVTIPENFSAAATSFSGDAADAEQATIDVSTSDKSRLVDDAISQVITTTAAGLVGNQLTTTYLENIYLGFNTLGDQLGTAATGAGSLASGATALSDGATSLADGTSELAAGASSLSSGISQLTDGVSQLSGGLTTLQQQTAALPDQAGQLASGAQGVATGITQVNGVMAQQAEQLQAQLAALQGIAVAVCTPSAGASAPADPALCQSIQQQVGSIATVVGTAAGTLSAVSSSTELSGGAGQVAAGMSQFAAGMPALTAGIGQSASGAAALAAAGSAVNSGTAELSDGVSTLAEGAQGLADGVASANDGAASLATGLKTAVDQLPTYSDDERTQLATVVAQPVVTNDSSGIGFGTNGVPFYATLALWLGGLASLIVLRAVPTSALGSTRSSLSLAVKALLPAALVGALQGLFVTGILSTVVDLDVGGWFAFTGIAVLVGIAFAATNQALVALLGGAGRFVSMIIALVLIGTSIIATAPALLDDVLGVMPVQPAQEAFRAVISGGAGGGAIVGLVVWALASLLITTLAIARKRTVTTSQLVLATA
ncbi:YhgE/Pip domain-containing protein [Leifsonia sp. A12D58]|uniref:YhgE/Pip domain-containing protein n=1 Tax=Leifsonia sp. A12D58 TaxID=3397674 RepID=UPI0039E0AB1F